MEFLFFQAFWPFCALWCGLGNALYLRFSMRKHVERGEFSQQEVAGFANGIALWIISPGLILWALQLSLPGSATPFFLAWPAPQKHAALTLQVSLLCALVHWVFFRGGAITLSKFRTATSKAPAFTNSPAAMKVFAIVAVIGSVSGWLLQDAMTY